MCLPNTQTLGLGSKPGDTEMSYLMIIPFNGDPIEVIVQYPGNNPIKEILS